MGWDKIKSASIDPNGLFVSPYPVRTRLENYRGIYLPFRENRDQIVAVIRSFAPALRGLPDDA